MSVFSSACCNHDILFAIDLISDRGGEPACGQLVFPNHFAGFLIESADSFVFGGGNED
jgi:hypothetical protein